MRSAALPRQDTRQECARHPRYFLAGYKLTQTANCEEDEFSEVLVRVGGTRPGDVGVDYVARIAGNGNGGTSLTTGWQVVEVSLGTLTAGAHTLMIGGYNNRKTFNDETTQILIDDVIVR